mmetsp:Transcript_3745/g.7257  ORF Transcript_3745/g.7257 Transcript_3745/m.7257 type:complete len:205 (-) Transcript_3745:260-874(-)
MTINSPSHCVIHPPLPLQCILQQRVQGHQPLPHRLPSSWIRHPHICLGQSRRTGPSARRGGRGLVSIAARHGPPGRVPKGGQAREGLRGAVVGSSYGGGVSARVVTRGITVVAVGGRAVVCTAQREERRPRPSSCCRLVVQHAHHNGAFDDPAESLSSPRGGGSSAPACSTYHFHAPSAAASAISSARYAQQSRQQRHARLTRE